MIVSFGRSRSAAATRAIKPSAKSLFRQNAWASVLFAILGALISLRYLTGLPNSQGWQFSYVLAAAAGVFFIGHLLLQTILVFPLQRLGFSKAARATAFFLTFILLVALVTDTFVYQQYRFHINWSMIDLALVGGSDVFSFSVGMKLWIGLLVLCIAAISGLLIWASRAIQARVSALVPCLVILVAYVAVNGVHAYAVSQNVKSVTVLKERIPLYYPLRANRFLAKLGLEPVVPDNVKLAEASGSFHYPLQKLSYGQGKDLNVVILALDSLRADVVDPVTMPNLHALKEKTITFNDHYSAGNATRAGIFGLFYGLPPSYWHSALATNIPAALTSGFQHEGFEIAAFTTATLLRPEFYATVFSGVHPLRLSSTKGGSVCERDVESVDDFEKWLKNRDNSRKFFSFIFLDSVHAVAFPDDLDVPYKDYWKEVNNLELGPDFDPKPYFARYKNSAFWVDTLIARVWKILEENGRLKDTILIVTSDHGEEFNDNKLNYWGHNGNFSQAQIKIPLQVYWPGMQPQEVNYRTTAYDVSTTLMKRVLDVHNSTQDFSVGLDLFSSEKRKAFFVGSYSEDAIIAGNEVLQIKMSGAMEGHSLLNWQEIDDSTLKKYIPAYLQMRGKYRQ